MAQLTINYTATADLSTFSSWLTSNVASSTYDSTTQEGTLTLNDGVAWFASGTFENCTDLLTITLPVGFLYLYGPRMSSDTNGVFSGCTNLTTVNILETNIEIKNATFYKCSSLTSINFSDLNQKIIYPYTFFNCSSLLQSNFNWNNLNQIQEYAFYGCKQFTSLDIPNIEHIAQCAFSGCTNLTTVNAPKITLINQSGFSGCTSLTSITLGNVTQINSYGFSGCTSLTSITLPKINRIENAAFNNCLNLTAVCFLTLPPTLVGNNHFTASNATLKIPCIYSSEYQVTPWTSYFSQIDCINIIRYTATADLKAYSTWLQNNVDQNISTWDSTTNEGVLALNNGVTSIGDNAFQNCTTLTYIELPDITGFSIGNNAFNGCSNLITVSVLSTNPPTLGTGNFTAQNDILCVYPESVSLYKNDISWNSVFSNIVPFLSIQYTATKSLAENMSSYLKPAFLSNEYDSGTQNGTLLLNGRYYNNLPQYIFNYDTSLISVTLSEGITTINMDAFSNCSNLISVTLPDGLTALNSTVFQYCSKLESINLPSSLANIGYQCFRGCSKLESITLPENLTTISSGAFKQCSSLKTVYYNAINVTSMNQNIFPSITDVIISDIVTSIPQFLFDVNSLKTVTCLATTPPSLDYYNFPASDDTLWVKGSSKAAYEANTTWRNAFTTIAGFCEVTSTVTGNGSVSPSPATVPEGESATLTITPDSGYGIFSVTDNGTSVPVTSTGMTYTISNIAADHAIAVVFKPLFTITTSAGEGGSITPTTEVLEGESITVIATPNTHYRVSHFIVDGVDVGTVDNYTFNNLADDHTIHVDFELITHTITATAGEGGSISPESSTVVAGSDVTLTITPDEGMLIFNVLDNDTPVPVLNPLGMTYTISNIQENHTVEAIFMVAQNYGFDLSEMIDTDFIIQTLEELEERK